MDPQHFDTFVKTLTLRSARRGVVTGLATGALATLASYLAAGAWRRKHQRDNRDSDDVSGEKKKKRKKKNKKGKSNTPQNPTIQAPPCAETSCPLPPGCVQEPIDSCTAALAQTLLSDLEPCQARCGTGQGGETPDCLECLEPILRARIPDAVACVDQGCALGTRMTHRAARASAHEWWPRSCEKPTCCFISYRDCEDDNAETLFKCLFGAAVAAATTGPGTFLVLGGCMGNLVYNHMKCRTRYGCANQGETCANGDHCCPHGQEACSDGACCPFGTTCCGEKCCDASQNETCHLGLPGEPSSCCEPGWQACHGACCFADNKCCKSQSGAPYCCHPNARCCDSGSGCCV